MSDARNQPRSWIVLAGIPVVVVALVVLGISWAKSPNQIPMRDFVEYWSAGAVNLRQGNPYDSDELLPIQREIARDPDLTQATMMWNPPWALAIFTPLALLPANVAHLVWLIVQLTASLVSAEWLWRTYGGHPDKKILAHLLAISLAPFLVLMWYGQVGALCLLGLSGFLFFQSRARPILAGAFVALTALKPHLLFAVGLLLILDGFVSRRARIVLVSGAATVGLAAFAAWLGNPHVYEHYRNAGWETSSHSHTSPKDWFSPVLADFLRRAIAPDRFSLQFLPTIFVSLLTIVYWYVRRNRWDWRIEMPRAILASTIAAAYGAWVFDLVVLLVPIVQAAVWLTSAPLTMRIRILAATYVSLNFITAIGPIIAGYFDPSSSIPLHWFVYYSPAILMLYLSAARERNRTNGTFVQR